MRRAVKWALITVASVAAVAASGIAYLAVTFDPNAYKHAIAEAVKKRTGRTLQLDGAIGLAFYPTLSIRIAGATLSERDSDKAFASVGEAVVAVKAIPLLSKEIIVEAIEAKKLQALIVRDKSGRYNVEDLTGDNASDGQPSSTPTRIDIDHISIAEGDVTIVDVARSARYRLSRLDLKTGRVANGVTTPFEVNMALTSSQHNAQLDTKLKGKVTPDWERALFRFSDVDTAAKGHIGSLTGVTATGIVSVDLHGASGELTGHVRAVSMSAKAPANTPFKVEAPALTLTKDSIAGDKMTVTASLGDAKNKYAIKADMGRVQARRTSLRAGTVEARVDGQHDGQATKAHITGSLNGNPENNRFELGNVNATIDSVGPGRTTKARVSGALVTRIDTGRFEVSNFVSHIETQGDGRTIKAHVSGALAGNAQAKQFELARMALDLSVSDPKLPKGVVDTALRGTAKLDFGRQTGAFDLTGRIDRSNVTGKASMTRFSPLAIAFEANADQFELDRFTGNSTSQKIDLSALKGLNATGKLRIGKLSAFNLKAAEVRAEIKLSNARLTAAPLSAQLYQGTTNGSVSASAGAVPLFTVRQTLSGVSVGPLLHDAAQIDTLEAKGNVTLDMTAQGATVDALKKSLSGTASVNLADGAIRGFDVAGTLRTAKARLRELRGEHVQQTNVAQKTDFSELKATLKIKDGIARNDDLAIKSPLLRLGGAGDLDIGAARISYLLKATVVATSKGQGGKDLAELNGLMVPVKLTGALDRPQYSIDFTGMAVDLARREVQDELLRRATGQISTSSIRERVIKGIIAR